MADAFQVGDTTFAFDVDTSVPAAILTILVTETNNTGRRRVIDRIIATGEVSAEFSIFFNASQIIPYRTSQQDRTMKIDFSPGLPFAPGDTVEIRVEHNAGANREFKGTVQHRRTS